MSRNLHKTTLDPKKRKGASEPKDTQSFEERRKEQRKRIVEQHERSEARKGESVKKEEGAKKGAENPNVNWDKLRRDLTSKFGSEEQIQASEKFADHLQGKNGFSIQRQAFRLAQEKVRPEPIPGSEQLLKLVKGKKMPESVSSIINLVVALNSYKGDKKGEISLGTDLARLAVIGGLGQALQQYARNKNEEQFKEACTQIMTEFYKPLAADVSLWNAIKEFIKPALVFLHIDTKRLLSSNDLIKDTNVQGMFKKVVQEGIRIADEEQIDTNLNKP
ncbi:hypothetical protein [Legionella bozemanae]|uniref:Uncharacterized protein n=1 Tax=Legionella bozemanae TaxID=447 RepID=A0A0W0RJ14_LEGBO|nr:hypothetical protein [Legionella bozemanae]KTC71033.1 hypothetical protein Lboz_2610 [Legionella bozemanae]STO34695.1 Uncharacterised protein [Legionella bozemanae]